MFTSMFEALKKIMYEFKAPKWNFWMQKNTLLAQRLQKPEN